MIPHTYLIPTTGGTVDVMFVGRHEGFNRYDLLVLDRFEHCIEFLQWFTPEHVKTTARLRGWRQLAEQRAA